MYELLGKQLLGSDTIGATIEASGFTIDQFLTICSIFDAELYGSDSKEEGLIDFFENVLTNQSLLNTFSRVYNSDYYIANNPDVVQLLNDDDPMLMLQHFLDVGMDEGKDSIANWNVNTYKESNADMEEAFGDDLRTYYVYYATEGFYETAQVD